MRTATLTTYYFGEAYEVTDGAVKKYYAFGGGTVAMRDGNGLQYFPSTSSGHRLTDHLGSVLAVTDASGTLISEQRYLPFGEVRTDVGEITQTDFGYTFQRGLPGTGLMDYRARFYAPYLNRFTQPDSIVPEPGNPQALNRYSYVRNQPINFNDPSGHWEDEGGGFTASKKKNIIIISGRRVGNSDGDGVFTPPPPKKPIWSTSKYKNEKLGEFLADLSTHLQHAANFFSGLGAISEAGFTSTGLFGGSAAVCWIDTGSPVADVSGGLAGGLVGWEVGHGIHTLLTNPIESVLSTASTLTTYFSDIANGNTRIDIYESSFTAVVGQPTATSTALTLLGNKNSVGIVDAAIDQVGSWYADGKIGGVYDLFGITGKTFSFSVMNPYLCVQFGDK